MAEGEAFAEINGVGVAEEEINGVGVAEEERVCSLCGDIGFQKSLLLCKKCGFRYQHLYCSRLYPDINMEKWSCEWCLHEKQHQQKMDSAAVVAAADDDYEIKRRKKRRRQRSNSKVFEFLLDIADQSSPEAERYTKLELEAKQQGKTSGVCERGDDVYDEYRRGRRRSIISEEKVMKQSSSSSSSFSYSKRKLDIGLESPTSTAAAISPVITSKLITTTSTKEKSSVAAAEMLKKAVTKNKSSSSNNSNKAALDRWRNLAANKNKLGCRRYKLLADVHC